MQKSQECVAKRIIFHYGTPTHFIFDMLTQNLMQTFSQECRYLTPWGDTCLMNDCMNECMYV